jgi:hypothetical protein
MNTSVFTCSGERLARVRDAVNPATEKTLSDVVSVAGIARYFLASTDSLGYEVAFCDHQISGFSFLHKNKNH